jgi:hypothetical protein
LKRTLPAKQYQTVVLYYGLDGNGQRGPTEISDMLNISNREFQQNLAGARRAFRGAAGVKFMQLLAGEIGKDLVHVEGQGWITPRILQNAAHVLRRTQLPPNDPFLSLPLEVLNVSPTILRKVRSELGLSHLHQMADYFRQNVFNGADISKTPFTRDELRELYDKVQPIFWPDRQDYRFLETREPALVD